MSQITSGLSLNQAQHSFVQGNWADAKSRERHPRNGLRQASFLTPPRMHMPLSMNSGSMKSNEP